MLRPICRHATRGLCPRSLERECCHSSTRGFQMLFEEHVGRDTPEPQFRNNQTNALTVRLQMSKSAFINLRRRHCPHIGYRQSQHSVLEEIYESHRSSSNFMKKRLFSASSWRSEQIAEFQLHEQKDLVQLWTIKYTARNFEKQTLQSWKTCKVWQKNGGV